jgi:protein-tyrosine-phosphatase
MEEIGLPLDQHTSKGIAIDDIDWADHILVMELRHQRDLHVRFPESEGKILLFGTFGGAHEVDDPVNRWMFRFRRTRGLLQRAAERFVAQLP